MNPGAETIQVTLHRNDSNEPWGFRLNGGIDFTTPLSVSQVNPGGVGDRCGLKAGDAVLSINNKPSDELEHEAAKYEILRSGNQVDMLIQRAAVSIWKPKVTALSDLKPQELSQINYGEDGQPYVQKTSLAYTQPEPLRIGSAHNRSARPFPGFGGGSSAPAPAPAPPAQYGAPGGGADYGAPPPPPQQQPYGAPPPPPQQAYGGDSQPALVHSQYNTPIQMYSGQNIADSYNVHAQGLSSELSGQTSLPQYGGGPGYGGQPQQPQGGGGAGAVAGMRSVRAPIAKPPGERKPEVQHATCQVCGSLCVGVFVKVKGLPLHPECYKCQRCGINLKQKGFIQIEGKFYCENCAR